ncbi:MAG TPA: dienelactone hydrolase [Candidatus Xenobia bacterium]
MKDLTLHDADRNRDIPLRVYLPQSTAPAPVILFSPGLGADRTGYSYLARRWSEHGYVVVVLQHPGSDDSVWRGVPPDQIQAALTAAVNRQSFVDRVGDVEAVLDQLKVWNVSSSPPLSHRLDLAHIGMGGHSYGAVTTQAVSGQTFPVPLTDARIQAALALSPSSPRTGDPKSAFGHVSIPWMLMTGTRDLSPIGHADVASRLAVFPALPPGDKYELVLNGAQHSAFSDRRLISDREPRNPNHHKAIVALSIMFWDAYLRGDAAARAWLKGPQPRTLLEAGDRWETR